MGVYSRSGRTGQHDVQCDPKLEWDGSFGTALCSMMEAGGLFLGARQIALIGGLPFIIIGR